MRRSSTRSGFTLLETVVTAFITMITLVGIHHLLLWIAYASGVSGQTTMAVDLAQQKMEQLMNTPFATVAGGSDAVPPYTRTWVVQGSLNGAKEIQVTMSWTDIRSKLRAVDIKSAKADESIVKNQAMFQNMPIGTP